MADLAHPPRERPVAALPSEVSTDLADLVSSSLAPDSDSRPTSVEAFRRAVEESLRHRGAHALALAADDRFDAARVAHAEGDLEAAELAATEAAYGFRSALAAWPESPLARSRARALLRFRVEDAIERDEVPVAERLLAAADDVPEDLAQQVVDARARADRKAADRAALEADVDRSVGLRTRRVIVAFFGLVWIGMFGSAAWFQPASLTGLISAIAVASLLGLAAIAIRRRAMVANRLNRTITAIGMTTTVGSGVWLVGASLMGLTTPDALTGMLMVWTVGAAISGLVVDLRSAPAAVVYAAGFFASAADDRWVGLSVIAGSVFFVGNLMVVNLLLTRDRERSAAAVEPGETRASQR